MELDQGDRLGAKRDVDRYAFDFAPSEFDACAWRSIDDPDSLVIDDEFPAQARSHHQEDQDDAGGSGRGSRPCRRHGGDDPRITSTGSPRLLDPPYGASRSPLLASVQVGELV